MRFFDSCKPINRVLLISAAFLLLFLLNIPSLDAVRASSAKSSTTTTTVNAKKKKGKSILTCNFTLLFSQSTIIILLSFSSSHIYFNFFPFHHSHCIINHYHLLQYFITLLTLCILDESASSLFFPIHSFLLYLHSGISIFFFFFFFFFLVPSSSDTLLSLSFLVFSLSSQVASEVIHQS